MTAKKKKKREEHNQRLKESFEKYNSKQIKKAQNAQVSKLEHLQNLKAAQEELLKTLSLKLEDPHLEDLRKTKFKDCNKEIARLNKLIQEVQNSPIDSQPKQRKRASKKAVKEDAFNKTVQRNHKEAKRRIY